MAKDFVHDAGKLLCSIDYDATIWQVFLCGVQTQDAITLAFAPAPVVIGTVVEPFIECLCINVQDEDLIKNIQELIEISRTAAEESDFVVLTGCQPPHFFHIPKITCVSDLGG